MFIKILLLIIYSTSYYACIQELSLLSKIRDAHSLEIIQLQGNANLWLSNHMAVINVQVFHKIKNVAYIIY